MAARRSLGARCRYRVCRPNAAASAMAGSAAHCTVHAAQRAAVEGIQRP
ncbi:hypothetical protein GFB82_20790 [Acinetobacter baumannii]|nr:hypothetical protein [Acinetobacter baumannii]